jgi:hypothetical protein
MRVFFLKAEKNIHKTLIILHLCFPVECQVNMRTIRAFGKNISFATLVTLNRVYPLEGQNEYQPTIEA